MKNILARLWEVWCFTVWPLSSLYVLVSGLRNKYFPEYSFGGLDTSTYSSPLSDWNDNICIIIGIFLIVQWFRIMFLNKRMGV